MNDYIQEIRKLLEAIPNIEPLRIETPVVIYGAGNSGCKASALLQEKGYSVLGFLDQHPKSTSIEEQPCILPNSEQASQWCNLKATVVIAVMNPQADSHDVNQALSVFSWNRIIPFPHFVELFHDQWGDHFWITHRDFYKDAAVRKVLLEIAERWEDQTSRDCFKAVLQTRFTGNLDPLDSHVRDNHQQQYFPNDIPDRPAPVNFVDCGAFDGDTLREIPRGKLKSIAAFEPDIKNFHALALSAKGISEFESNNIKVLLWPCGVWCESTSLNFNAVEEASSHLNESGKNTISVVALDDALQNYAPDFIKMDIEGAELEALKGASGIIEKHHPALAICVYHKPAHLWEILQLIDSWQCGYNFYLRAHQYNGLDVVLYAY